MAQATSIQAAADSKPPNSQLDPPLRHFADPTFDPVDFLNNTLPPLTRPADTPRDSRAVSIAELSSQTQSLLSELSAQNARLSNTLTQFTDEILRSGGRLAYEVEVLRGETIGLSDTLTEVLRNDIKQFVPDGLPTRLKNPEDEESTPVEVTDTSSEAQKRQTATDPDYIRDLRTLNQVRSRLEDVIHVFGEAMEWPLPPTEASTTSSFISVSPPGPNTESQKLEDKGREVAKKLKDQVTELLDSNGGGEAGCEAAQKRVESLRQLAGIWKGTIEEKARLKFVDSLAKIVDERRKSLDAQARAREGKASQPRGQSPATRGRQSSDHPRASQEGGGGGLFRNLQRLRDEIYLE